jgi:hypothetical protein
MPRPPSWIVSRPSASVADAAVALERWWGLTGTLDDLPSERDRNVRVLGSDGAPAWLLKIANLAEDPTFLECQHGAMARLARADVPVQRVIPALDGRELVGLGDSGPPWAWVLTFLPGKTLASVTAPGPANTLWFDLGLMMGRSATALLGYDHPAARRDFQWDVQRAEAVIATGMRDVTDPGHWGMLGGILAAVRGDLASLMPGLRRSIIHNDANDHNVLVDGVASRVVGLLDFGDMVHSVTAQEAAVAATYAMFGRPKPLAVLAAIVAGFDSACPLYAAELDALPYLVLARLGISVSISAHQARLDPDPYLRVSEAPAWALIARLEALGPAAMRDAIRDAVGR